MLNLLQANKAHLEFLETMLPKVSDPHDRAKVESDIGLVRQNIKAVERWIANNEKVKAQTGPLPGNGEANLDYPYSHGEGQSELGGVGELRKAISGVDIDALHGLKQIRPEDR